MKLYGIVGSRDEAIVRPLQLTLGIALVAALHLTSLYSYVLFHSLVELLQLTVIFGIFAITWHSRQWSNNNYLIFVGIAFPFVGILLLLHTLSYKGLGVFAGFDANLPTQFWIALRYLQASALLVAPALLEKRLRARLVMVALAILTAMLIVAIFAGYFPDCFIEGSGLTRFKINSEYVISALLLGGLVMLLRRRAAFDENVLTLLVVSLVAGIASEQAFTQYVSVYGASNEAGHFLSLLSTYFMYRAIVVTGLVNPFRLLFLGQKQKEAELESKVAERTLEVKQSEERFHGLADVAQDAIVMMDDRGMITYWNAAAERTFGYRHDEVVGKDLHQIIAPARYVATFRKGFSAFQESGGGPVLGKTIEFTAIRKSGEEFPVSVSISALRLQDRWHAVGILRDITESRHVEELRARLAAIVESTSVAIIGKDLNGCITSWNSGAERVYGYKAEEVLGQPISILAADAYKDETRSLLEKVRQGGSIIRHETVRRTKEGRDIDVSLTVSQVFDDDGKLIGVSTVAVDITERKRAERELIAANRALKTLSTGNMSLIHATDEKTLLHEMCRTIVEVGGYRFAWVGYADELEQGRHRLQPQAHAGADGGYLAMLAASVTAEAGRFPERDAIAADAVRICQDLAENGAAAWPQAAMKCGFKSMIALPLRSGGHVLGVLAIFSDEADTFASEEVKLLTEMAADLSYGIVALRSRVSESQSAVRLKKSMESTIRVVASTIEMRDPYTSGHQQRVAELAVAIGRAMGLDENRLYGIYLAGIVHDVGKITVPSELLSKPGRLQPIEYELIKMHAQAGYDILKPVDFPWPIAEAVKQHHERLDGSGYPTGLKGDAILIEARIIAVADVVEAISSHRPYRAALGISAGLKEIAEYRGTRYDPDVVDACMRLFAEDRFRFGGKNAFAWEELELPVLA